MKKTKIAALLLAGAMLSSAFAGCGLSNQSKSYAKIDGKATNGQLFESYLRYQVSSFTSQGADETQVREFLNKKGEDGKTGSDLIKEQGLDYLKMIAATEKLAAENDIKLTAEEKKAIKDDKDKQISDMGGRSKFVQTLKDQHMSEEVYDLLGSFGKLQQKTMSALFNNGGKFAMSEADVIKKVTDGNIRAKHILIQAKKEDKDYADKVKKAEGILARLNKGEDFDALMKELGEDPGMNSTPDGYIFNKEGQLLSDPSTTFDKTFTAESFKLQVNQVSGLVKTDFGIHIIKRFPLDEAYVKSKIDTFYPSFASEAFQSKLDEIVKTLKVETTDAYKNLDVASFIEKPQTQAAPGATTGAPAAPGTQSGAPASTPSASAK